MDAGGELALKATYIIDIQQRVTVDMANMIENCDGNTGAHVKRAGDAVRIIMYEVMVSQFDPGLESVFAACLPKVAAYYRSD